MFVSVELNFNGWRHIGDNKLEFWRRVEAERRGISLRDDDRADFYFTQEEADEYEHRFRLKFPELLNGLLSQSVESFDTGRSSYTKPVASRISARLIAIEYGSIKTILDLIGIDNNNLKDFTLAALEVYTPLAFRQATGSDVSLTPSIKIIDGKSPQAAEIAQTVPQEESDSIAAKSKSQIERAWIISNTSLIIPVCLSLAACYIVFVFLSHEMDEIKAQNLANNAEKVEIIKALVIGNEKISDALISQSKEESARDKNFSEALSNFVKSKASPDPQGIKSP